MPVRSRHAPAATGRAAPRERACLRRLSARAPARGRERGAHLDRYPARRPSFLLRLRPPHDTQHRPPRARGNARHAGVRLVVVDGPLAHDDAHRASAVAARRRPARAESRLRPRHAGRAAARRRLPDRGLRERAHAAPCLRLRPRLRHLRQHDGLRAPGLRGRRPDHAFGAGAAPRAPGGHRSPRAGGGERWLDHDARPPFFLFVHLWDPHYDYIPPPPYDTRFDPDYHGDFDFSDVPFNPRINAHMPERERQHLVALYDGEIAATDAVVGALCDALKRHGWLADTLLVVSADHGEEFFDHGHKGHMRTLFEEMIHVPLVIRFPGRVPAGRRLDAVFASIHLMPTILGLLGLPAPPLAPARDLSAMLRGSPVPQDLWAFAELEHGRERPLYAVRTGQRKYVGEIGEQAPVLVEDLATDAGEQHPTPADPGERHAFAAWVERAIGEPQRADRATGPAPTLDAETRRELGALGYIAGP